MHPIRPAEHGRSSHAPWLGTERRLVPGDPEESSLVERLRRGEDGAFNELVLSHGGSMLAMARRILGRDDDARDAVRKAFASASASVGGLRDGTRLAPWLRRITVGAVVARLDASPAGEPRGLDGWLPAFDATGHHTRPIRPWRDLPPDGSSKDELKRFVRHAIDALPSEYRIVLILRDMEDMSASHTAWLLGITEPEVATRLHRARQVLRTRLDPVMVDGEVGLQAGVSS